MSKFPSENANAWNCHRLINMGVEYDSKKGSGGGLVSNILYEKTNLDEKGWLAHFKNVS